MTLSKSNFVLFKSCPKHLWLHLNKPDEEEISATAETNIKEGKQVGDLAKGYFDNTADATSYKEDGSLDFENMIGLTNRYLMDGDKVIAEATFSINGLFCSVDLLKPVNDGYEIYEVKATTSIEDRHIFDVAFQKHVLELRGLKINKVYILHLNKEYCRQGDIEVRKLLKAEDVSCNSKFLLAYKDIKNDVLAANDILNKKKEPIVLLSSRCSDCPFKKHCFKEAPFPSVLDLQGSYIDRYSLYNSGVISFQDVLNCGTKLTRFQRNQIEAYLNNFTLIVDKNDVTNFLEQIKYPIYHLDFETIKLAVPPCDNAHPHDQIPTQYSLHIEYADGKIDHKEFLGDSVDPRRAIAESLCENIPKNNCVLAFKKSFENGCLIGLADLFPDLKDHLTNLASNLQDLADPFQKGYFYHKDMWNKYSIKSVLPALCPNDPELDYHALPVVHNGGEAMDIYPKMLEAEPEEKERIRKGLLQYCCLDTYAMVKILRRLKEETR